LPGEKRRFALIGVYGQAIYVNPELKLVMVQTAVARNASVSKETMGEESFSLWFGIEQHYQRAASP
jgi:CubicO group peptidase (beta-lactamase class C family)